MLDANARSLNPRTIADYQNAFRKLQASLGDPPIESISTDDIRRFLADLPTPRAPAGIAPRPARPIGKKQKLDVPLQNMLGHKSLDLLRTYTPIEQVDIVNGHQLASPVVNGRMLCCRIKADDGAGRETRSGGHPRT